MSLSLPTLLGRLQTKLRRTPRVFALFFATSIAARGIGIACQFVQVALIMKTLGAEAFGLWVTLTGATNLMLFADLGLGIGVQNRLAELFAHDGRNEARVIFNSAFAFLSGLALVLAAIAFVIMPRLDLAHLFHLRDAANAAAASGAAAVVAVTFCLGFPFGLAQRVAFARQEGWAYNVAQAGGNLLSVILVAAGTTQHWSLIVLVACSQGARVLGNIALLFVQLWQLRWLAFWRSACRFSALRSIIRLGACFGVQQVLTTVLYTLPQIIISTALGTTAVVPYNLLQRLFNLFAIVQNAFMLPLWPAYSQAKARGEFGWMRSALRHSLHATLLCSILPMGLGAIVAPQIVGIWVGHHVAGLTLPLVAVLFAWNAVSFLQQPFSFLLAGVSEVRRTTFYAVASAGLSTALMIGLARPCGTTGVAAGLLLGFLPFSFLGNLIETRRYLRDAPGPINSTPATITP